MSCGSLLAIHANADTMTEPSGSIELFERADCSRKTLVLISGPSGEPGLFRSSINGVASEGSSPDVLKNGQQQATKHSAAASKALGALHGLNMWHSITTEPGCEKVSIAVAKWMVEEATRAVPPSSPRRRLSKSPARSKRT